jgi:hypothetical protein
MDEAEALHALERQVDRLENKVAQNQQIHVSDFEAVHVELNNLRDVSDKHITLDRYRPVERLVFGAVALVLIGVVTSLIALVVRQPG